MARLTDSDEDILHLEKVSDSFPRDPIVGITLGSGDLIVGVVRTHDVGNNGGDGGWRYFGSVDIQLISGETVTVDYLDIEEVIGVWEKYRYDFRKAGLLTNTPALPES